MSDARRLLPAILALHDGIRTAVLDAFATRHRDDLAGVAHDDEGDTIYAVDRVSEAALVDGLADVAREEPLVLVAEGLPAKGLTLPKGTHDADCRWRLLVDPIDGTRGLIRSDRRGFSPGSLRIADRPLGSAISSSPCRPRFRCSSSTCAISCGRCAAKAFRHSASIA